MTPALSLLYLLIGFVLLIWSADRLVAGASALARNYGVPAIIVGVTIVGFGTSAPELVVSALAALEGNPSLAIGNALGSNIANVGLILGITGLIYPMNVDRATCTREIPLLALVTLVVAWMMLDFQLIRLEGGVLLGLLGAFLLVMIARGLRASGVDPATEALMAEIAEGMPNRRAVMWTGVGLIVLPVSAQILVTGAIGLAGWMGVSEAVIGLTVVALGTSLPELAAAAASAVRKEDDLCIGNILGSNIFNLLGVLGIAAIVHPMDIERILVVRDLPVMTATFLLLAAMALFAGKVGRVNSALLLVVYAAYEFAVFDEALHLIQ